MDLIFSTHNAHKLQEVHQILGQNVLLKSLDDIGMTEDIPETADTLEGNSAQKARYVYERTGCNCFADDTGLCVEALGDEPGVYSARYAALFGNGEGHDAAANRRLLLQKMQGIPNRKACFKTVVTLILDGQQLQFEGRVDGVITLTEQGDGGFGYDCIFQPEGYDRTFAELPAEVKNAISHRARAMAKLSQTIGNYK